MENKDSWGHFRKEKEWSGQSKMQLGKEGNVREI